MKRFETKFLIALLLPFAIIMGGGIWGSSAQHTHRSASQGGLIPWIPTGFVGCYAGTTPPTNTVESYGQQVSRVTYESLFAQIGTTYGAGDGSTTFNLPDLRGRVMVGMDNMGGSAANRITAASLNGANSTTLGGVGGAETHTLTNAQIPPLEIRLSMNSHTLNNGTDYYFQSGAFTTNRFTTGGGISSTSPFKGIDNINGGGAHSITQPWIALKCVIGT